eukprot:3337037-Pleurochrysis_carterae.AAC.1
MQGVRLDAPSPPPAFSHALLRESPQELKGCVTLNQCEVTPLAPSEVDGRPFGFKLSPISKKIFFICAPDEEARQSWMSAVAQNSCARAGSTAELNPLEANDPDPAHVHNVRARAVHPRARARAPRTLPPQTARARAAHGRQRRARGTLTRRAPTAPHAKASDFGLR